MKEGNNYFPTQFGLSLLRILATFSVIVIHVSGSLVNQFGIVSMFDWNVANFFDSISRYSVPVFFMISGALLLGKDYELIDFLRKRFGKIIPPFVFWSLIYSLLKRYVFGGEYFSLIKIIKDVFYGSKYHLWFVFALFGVYLTVPILRKWIKQASKKEIIYVLIIWSITLLLTIPKFKIYFPKIDFTYFSGFIGYFVLGYFLSLFKFKKKISIFLIFFGSTITFLGTYYFTVKNGKFYNYFYEYLCLNTFIVSAGVFMFFNKIESANLKIALRVTQLNQACFGIYLMHPLVLEIFKINNFDVNSSTPLISILLVSLSCFSLCFVIIHFCKKLKFSNLLVG
ncbi:acyltransferase [Flavobacterium aestuarii]|uniref:acyltransferase n=1 Tax=Flavobacterium aestuarii TaxID=3149227 RepID=UPI0032B553CC